MSRPFSGFAFDWKAGWATRPSGRANVDDSRFSDEDILTILHAGESGIRVEALCAASDISAETYYVWKAKYGGLDPAQLRARRLKERGKGRRLAAASVAAATTAIVLLSLGYAFVAPMRGDSAPVSSPVAQPPAPSAKPTHASQAEAAAAAPGRTDAPRTAPPHEWSPQPSLAYPDATNIESADPKALSVQVAAVPSLADARVAMERLAALGYPVHMTTKVVEGTDLYRVRVGPLKSRAVAEDVARQLERDGFASPWITR